MVDLYFIGFILGVLFFSTLLSLFEFLTFVKFPKLVEKESLFLVFFILGIVLSFFSISQANLFTTGPLAMASFGLLCVFSSAVFFVKGYWYSFSQELSINKVSTNKGISLNQIEWFLLACFVNSFPGYIITGLIYPLLLF